MKRLIVTIVLLLVLVAGIAGGLIFRGKNMVLRAGGEAVVAAARAELEAAQAEYAALDPAGAEEEAEQLAMEHELLTQAQEEADRLAQENEALDAAIRAAEQELEEKQADEDYAYYKAVYDALAEGKAKVESYLEDN